MDGVKVWKGERDWALVIPHSHKPYFVVTVEGDSAERADGMVAHYSGLVEKWRDEG